jgi:hypothetical protein
MGRRGRIQREMILQTEATPSFSRSRATLAIPVVLGQTIAVDLDDIEGCEVPLVVSPPERHLLFGLLSFRLVSSLLLLLLPPLLLRFQLMMQQSAHGSPTNTRFALSCTAVGTWKRSCNCTYNVFDITTPG